MAGILDYLSDGYLSAAKTGAAYIKKGTTAVADMVKGTSVGNAAGAVYDAGAKVAMPKRQPLIDTSAKNYEVNKYKINNHSYPMDLLTPIYGGNYAIFYINVSDASSLFLEEEKIDPSQVEKRMRPSIVANAKAIENTFDSAIGQVNKLLPDSNQVDVKAVKNAVPFNGRSQRRLKTAIALHVPNQLSVQYATNWGTAENTATVQALMSAGNSGINAVGEALSLNGGAAAKNLTDALGVGAEAFVANKMAGSPYAGAISAATGTTANPKKEQTFEGVEFRKFTFDYQFYPRDEFEAENVLNIIHQFKLHMHPEFKSELNYVWIYPSEFDIIYYTKGVENTNLHKHTSCVLKDMTVNYTPNGSFSVFPNGMPTQINLSMTFQELMLASKETIGLTPGGL